MEANTAAFLLFEKKFGNGTIFFNRLDLIKGLIGHSKSKYFLKDQNAEIILREINKLQSYISHLLSGTGKRKLTDEFKESLYLLIKERLSIIQLTAGEEVIDIDGIFAEVISNIDKANALPSTQRNLPTRREESEYEDLIRELKKGRYIAVFTSRPIELEANPTPQLLEIRELIVRTIIDYFVDESNEKKLRYNFHNETIGILFWRRISFLLVRKISGEPALILSLEAFIQKHSLGSHEKRTNENSVGNDDRRGETKVVDLVNTLLEYCNNKTFIQVYFLNEPVFVIPHIVINPNEVNNSSGYLFLGTKDNTIVLHKYSPYALGIWREKVWDLIKANKNSEQIKFTRSINMELDL